ncbi:MAG: tyrosine-type recombinase/integrase [Spirochaetota bacterium]|nr:MAG: tyrosine-type recombinase/integrase [Spirochaetota bacterium]
MHRIIPIHPLVLDRLIWDKRPKNKRYPWVFPGENPIYPIYHGTWVKNRWVMIKKQYGLPDNFNLHDLRHSFRTALFNNGINEMVINMIMGHKKGKGMEAVYTHISMEQMKKAINTLTPPIEHEENVEFDIEKERLKRAN